LGNDTGHVLFGLGAQPKREAVGEQIFVGLLFGDDAAAHGNDRAIALMQNAFERATLNRAITGLAVQGENLSERHSRIFFDFVIELDEGEVAVIRKLASERGLAGATQADQSDARQTRVLFRAEIAHQPSGRFFETMAGQSLEETKYILLFHRRRLAGSEQLLERDVQDIGDAPEQQNGNVAFPRFQLREVALGNVGCLSKHFAGHATAVAKIANARAKKEQELFPGRLLGEFVLKAGARRQRKRPQ
jgi:hypothetical protein